MPSRTRSVCLITPFVLRVFFASMCSPATAQCDPAWSTELAPPVMAFGEINDIALYDPDAEGPAPASLYKCGHIVTSSFAISALTRWDGKRWIDTGVRPGGATIDDGAKFLIVYDEDGGGPTRPLLVVGGFMRIAGSSLRHSILTWNGAGLGFLGNTSTANVTALDLYDFDDLGPARSSLIASVIMANSGMPAGIVRWTGAAWEQVGTNPPNYAYAFAAWDNDGVPETAPILVAAGYSGIHLLGAAGDWSPIEEPPIPPIFALDAFDIDGSGPQPPELVAQVRLSEDGPFSSVMSWNGARWIERLAPYGYVRSLRVFDSDGDGPSAPKLYFGGRDVVGEITGSHGKVASWDGDTWADVDGFLSTNDQVTRLRVIDLDGEGPDPARLVACGAFWGIGDGPVYSGAAWDGSRWCQLTDGLEGRPRRIAQIDPDGDGPEDAQLVVAGPFRDIGGVEANGIARWDGHGWQAFGEGITPRGVFSYPTTALVGFDPDGGGPAPNGPVVATSNPGKLIRWTGAAWEEIAPGSALSVSAMVVFDGDNDGDSTPSLVAAGGFTSIGGVEANRVARWDGGAWSPMGVGLGGGVAALAVYDEDGAGPMLPSLIAGGGFTTLGDGTVADRIAKWNGSAWAAFGVAPNSPPSVFYLAVLDDGVGIPSLFAGTRSTGASSVREWRSGSWTTLPGVVSSLFGLAVFDDDGDGPSPVRLFSSGFESDGPQFPPFPSVKRWDGALWSLVGGGNASPGVGAMAAFDPDGQGGRPPMLVGVSDGYVYNHSSGNTFPNLGLLVEFGRPALPVTLGPAPALLIGALNASLTLSVHASGGDAVYQWSMNGAKIDDGGDVSGAYANVMTINPLRAFYAGSYQIGGDQSVRHVDEGTHRGACANLPWRF